jgi:metal-dependent amidase/aminoacylase/carboxypeptidase family protein
MMPEHLAPTTIQKLRELTSDLFPLLCQIRRDLHRHPELSGEESWTAGYLAENLERLGLDVKTGVGGHGVIADLVQDPAGPLVAMRVDIDALPIYETNEVPYQSAIPGVMHACGHDVHSAIGVGTAAVLAALRDGLAGNVRFIFQPEEEEITGALRMIRAGALADPKPNAIFGLHIAPIPAGQIAWTDDLFLAGFEHTLCTLSSQAGVCMSAGHLDAVAERCCQVIRSFNHWDLPQNWETMQDFWQKMEDGPHALRHFIIYDASRDPEDPSAWPGQFGIGIKAANPHLRKTAIGRIKASLNTICQVTRTHYQLDPMGTMLDMRNNLKLTHAVLPALQAAVGKENLRQLQAAFPFNCEDFAYYTKHIPGLMIWLGGANPQRGKYAILHTPDFDVDETCIKTGVLAMSAMLIQRLQEDK